MARMAFDARRPRQALKYSKLQSFRCGSREGKVGEDLQGGEERREAGATRTRLRHGSREGLEGTQYSVLSAQTRKGKGVLVTCVGGDGKGSTWKAGGERESLGAGGDQRGKSDEAASRRF